jgi:CRISPR-associated protein Cpf1
VRKYALSKTLRFELKPVGETAGKIEDFKNKTIASIVEQDKKRAEDYKKIKKIIDDYHRYFIEQVLVQEVLTGADIQKAFESYVAFRGSKDESKRKDYQAIQKNLRTKIAKAFKEQSDKYCLFDAGLLNEKGTGKNRTKGLLWIWLKHRLDNKQINQSEFEEAERLIKSFDRFSTYFTGFNQNRQNIYSAEEQQTAISYRIIHDNMVKHFNNCLSFQAIQQNHKDLAEQMKDCKDVFNPATFKSYLGQTGIDCYNEKIGHKPDDINAKGVNQLINEYCQKNSTKNDKIKLPKMAILYKQILSDVEDKFKIDVFETDRQMLETINQFYLDIKDNLESIKTCLGQYLAGNNLEKIYIKKDSLTDISQNLWGSWGFINFALEKYADEILRLNEKKKEKWVKQDTFSIGEIQKALDNYFDGCEEKTERKILAQYFVDFKNDEHNLIVSIENAYQQTAEILPLEKLDKDRREPKGNNNGGKGFLQVEKIKELLDSIMAVVQFVKPLYLIKSGKIIEVGDKCTDFYDTFDGLYRNVSACIGIYNKTRNYVTQKPYSTNKFKINFENSTLLDGWDVNKETANSGILLIKDGRYYLGIMRKDTTDIFNYMPESDDSAKKQQTKKLLKQQVIADGADDYYEKMIYKLLPDPAKMLPKVFFSDSNINSYAPSGEILEIREKGLYKKEAGNPKAISQWIDFLKESIKKHPEWGAYFSFIFSPTADYADTSEFYKEVAQQGYNISFDKIKASYINEKVKAGELYLFEIYNKDFSSYSKGKPNLHTSYWKLLFSPENLNDLVLKLNGQAEIFFRPTSINKSETPVHKAKQSINNKNQLNPKKQSSFDYDIVKDRRFTADKFFFHCPITLNFRSASIAGRFNDAVNGYLKDNPDVNIIGIDRGERHLLYYSVINKNGQIVEQASFNTVANSYNSDGRDIDVKTDYHKLLDEKEKQRDAARKSWSTIENIKELKSGYLSHIVHNLASLMIKYNAVIILEDLNFGFKRGRFKVEKQVYQKFEQALIDKLNYLVFKNSKAGQAGHYLNAYQLTAPFESFQKLGKQSGFLFYVLSHYTSKIDPVTGFVNLLDTTYASVEKSQKFFKKFDGIIFNAKKNYFEFSFNYANFPPDKSGSKKDWAVCTAGKERYRHDKQKKESVCYDVTAELIKLFDKYGISYKNGENLVNVISNNDKTEFFKNLLFYLGLTLQLRHSYKDGDEEKDFILSPVADKDGNFFDSRKAKENQPKDADANGAFNIARKGLMVLRQIRCPDIGKPDVIKNADWFNFAQSGR